MPFYGTKASNQCLEFDAQKSDFFSLERVRKDTGELTLRLLTSWQTEDTLRAMDVLHERGQHSEVPLLDSPANNCDRDNAERVRLAYLYFPGGRTLTNR